MVGLLYRIAKEMHQQRFVISFCTNFTFLQKWKIFSQFYPIYNLPSIQYWKKLQYQSMMNQAEALINKIITYSSKNNNLLQKYSTSFFLNYFDKKVILSLQSSIEVKLNQKFNEEDFIKFMLLRIEHNEDQTLYLGISLRRLFADVLERTSNCEFIEFRDFTNYLCEKIANEDLDLVMPAKKINKEVSYTSCKQQNLKNDDDQNDENSHDFSMPQTDIYTKVQFQIPKINKDCPRKNKKLQGKKNISNFFYCKKTNQIITSGVLSSEIFIYNDELCQPQMIKPKICKELQKDIGIISMAYSQCNHRIGVILTNNNMIFWEGVDNYTTEKIIANKNYGDKIFYLDHTHQWITCDRNSLHFWDLKEQKVINSLKVKDSVMISDICYITHLKGICVSAQTSKEEKLLMIYNESKLMAKINLGNAGCHTLHYNILTQSLIPLGYTNSLPVYTIVGRQFYVELKETLHGHRSILTCVDSNNYNTLMITGDDIGQIRIWQLTYMRCIQSVKISKWLSDIKLIGNRLYYSDTRINYLKLQNFQPHQVQKPTILYQFYDKKEEFFWLFTKKDVRKIDIRHGKNMKIIILCSQQQEISSALALGDGFAIGTSKGQIFHYDSDCKLKWKKEAHDGQVIALLYDKENRLIFSLGQDNRILIWSQRGLENEEYRKSITYKDCQINLMSISQRNTLLLLGNTEEKQLYIWDYEILKFHKILKLQQEINMLYTSIQLDLIIVVTYSQIYLLKYKKENSKLELQIIQKIKIYEFFDRNTSICSLELILKDKNQEYHILLGTSQGELLNIDLSSLIKRHYVNRKDAFLKNARTNTKKQSVNILRTQKEQYSCHQNRQYIKISQLNIIENDEPIMLAWNKKIFKDSINYIHTCTNFNKQIVCFSQDYLKVVQITNGVIIGSVHVDSSLPIKWNVQLNHHETLKAEVCAILKIIDRILKRNGYQMLIKEYKMINITNFMEKITQNDLFDQEKTQKNKNFMTEIHRNLQIQQNSQFEKEQPSLKALEAYKRVKIIKKNSENSMNMQSSTFKKKTNLDAQINREYVCNLLKRKEKSKNNEIIDKSSPLYDFSNRLQESCLPVIHNRKKKTTKVLDDQHLLGGPNKSRKGTFKENIINANNRSTQNLSMVIKQQEFKEELQKSNIKNILAGLNQKLSMYKTKNSRVIC